MIYHLNFNTFKIGNKILEPIALHTAMHTRMGKNSIRYKPYACIPQFRISFNLPVYSSDGFKQVGANIEHSQLTWLNEFEWTLSENQSNVSVNMSTLVAIKYSWLERLWCEVPSNSKWGLCDYDEIDGPLSKRKRVSCSVKQHFLIWIRLHSNFTCFVGTRSFCMSSHSAKIALGINSR